MQSAEATLATPQANAEPLNDVSEASVKSSVDAPTSCQAEQTQQDADEQREREIEAAGLEVIACMDRYAASSCLTDRGAADRARIRMQTLISGRSPAQVSRMLAGQAQRMAVEPGAEKA